MIQEYFVNAFVAGYFLYILGAIVHQIHKDFGPQDYRSEQENHDNAQNQLLA